MSKRSRDEDEPEQAFKKFLQTVGCEVELYVVEKYLAEHQKEILRMVNEIKSVDGFTNAAFSIIKSIFPKAKRFSIHHPHKSHYRICGNYFSIENLNENEINYLLDCYKKIFKDFIEERREKLKGTVINHGKYYYRIPDDNNRIDGYDAQYVELRCVYPCTKCGLHCSLNRLVAKTFKIAHEDGRNWRFDYDRIQLYCLSCERDIYCL